MDLRNLFRNNENTIDIAAGATLFEQGDAGDVMYVLLEGQIAVQLGEETLEAIEPGDIVGEMALIDGKPRSATAVAKSDSRLAKVDERKFLFMAQQTPFFSLLVMRILADRLRRRQTA